MTNTNTTDYTSTTIDTLNDLIENCKDGEYGFRTSAENVRSNDLKQLFMRRSEECGQAARDLQTQVAKLGGDAEDTGTVAGAAHRGWVAVKGKLAGYTDLAILEETERGEDVALERYRSALEEELLPDVRALVERQLEGVKRNHSQIRNLRDQLRTTAS